MRRNIIIRYIRIIYAQVSVDGHHLEVIGSDGGALEPISVRSFVVHPGERFDFVPVKRTEDKEATHFAMRFAGLFDCAPTKARYVGTAFF